MLRNHGFFLVIVEYLDVVRVAVPKREDDSILIVDADRMKSFKVAAQFLQSVARRNPKVSQGNGTIE